MMTLGDQKKTVDDVVNGNVCGPIKQNYKRSTHFMQSCVNLRGQPCILSNPKIVGCQKRMSQVQLWVRSKGKYPGNE